MNEFQSWWLFLIILLFAVLTVQDWKLKKRLNSPAWWWEIGGMTLASVGFVVRLLISSWLTPEQRVNIALISTTIMLLCFIISRHLMHTSIEAMLKWMRAGAKTRQERPGPPSE